MEVILKSPDKCAWSEERHLLRARYRSGRFTCVTLFKNFKNQKVKSTTNKSSSHMLLWIWVSLLVTRKGHNAKQRSYKMTFLLLKPFCILGFLTTWRLSSLITPSWQSLTWNPQAKISLKSIHTDLPSGSGRAMLLPRWGLHLLYLGWKCCLLPPLLDNPPCSSNLCSHITFSGKTCCGIKSCEMNMWTQTFKSLL